MSPPGVFLISSSAVAPLPPKPPNSPPQLDVKLISRRNAVVLLSLVAPLLPALHHPSPASAFSLGISGPKQWLKEQKKKSAKFLLAPVDASRNSLQAAYLLLMKSGAEFSEKELDEIQSLLKSAARDCVPQDRNSFVQFQSRTGVEVCTFQLVVNNASSLLDDKDPIKLEAESKLTDVIRCFASLNGMTSELDIQVASNRQKIADALMDTVSSLNNFEQGVKDCLET
nr:uncharacterized protein LOC109149283 [Ipomoea batatas]GMD41738.1 uncharacterized protein LOC109149283 [Ipomoea batatas]